MGLVVSSLLSDKDVHHSPFDKLIHAIVSFPSNGAAVPVFSKEELVEILNIAPTKYDTLPLSSMICNTLKEKFGIDAVTMTRSDLLNTFKDIDDHVHPSNTFVVKEIHVYVKYCGGCVVTLREDLDRVLIEAVIPKSGVKLHPISKII